MKNEGSNSYRSEKLNAIHFNYLMKMKKISLSTSKQKKGSMREGRGKDEFFKKVNPFMNKSANSFSIIQSKNNPRFYANTFQLYYPSPFFTQKSLSKKKFKALSISPISKMPFSNIKFPNVFTTKNSNSVF